jgi:hypothetical protein
MADWLDVLFADLDIRPPAHRRARWTSASIQALREAEIGEALRRTHGCRKGRRLGEWIDFE